MKPIYFLGVDGGGTGSRSLLTDASGNALARAEGGPSNVATDMDAAGRNLAELTRLTFAQAGLGEDEMAQAYAVLGLAGSNVVATHKPIEDAVPCAHVHVTNDPDVVLAGALGTEQDGVIAAPGTGSFFISRKNGKLRRLGGWGFILGDEASGASLGRQLLSLSIHAHDGVREHTPLSREILASFDGDPSKMVQFAQEATPGDFGKYARKIVKAAQSGDALGLELMQGGADWIVTALKTLGHVPGMKAVLWGGLGQSYLPYLPTELVADLVEPDGDAALGGVRIAIARAKSL